MDRWMDREREMDGRTDRQIDRYLLKANSPVNRRVTSELLDR